MALLRLEKISKSFTHPKGEIIALQDISFRVEERQFISVVGPSECGKSTLLRIINGLLEPGNGRLFYKEKEQNGVNLECAMVFQSFALFPWLTVQENVELGLEARGLPLGERRTRASFYIDKAGLGGNEDAYPRELSGGTKQRVGLARALAIEPTILLMDEPFSSLDPLTSIVLRGEVLSIWQDEEIPLSTILMVTHIIEEAVEMADRVLILSPRPGQIEEDIPIELPRPRDKKTQEFNSYVDKIFSLIA